MDMERNIVKPPERKKRGRPRRSFLNGRGMLGQRSMETRNGETSAVEKSVIYVCIYRYE